MYYLLHILIVPIEYTYAKVMLRTMFASFWLGLAIFGIFELGNCFTDSFGDDPADLGAYIYTVLVVGVCEKVLYVYAYAIAVCVPHRLVRWQATS